MKSFEEVLTMLVKIVNSIYISSGIVISAWFIYLIINHYYFLVTTPYLDMPIIKGVLMYIIVLTIIFTSLNITREVVKREKREVKIRKRKR
ncbi:MAG: hypothetical protein B6V02_00195 [Thermoprotei archaeon ex4572_64]|nr:MAG: hypothetical protein B6V02_00195 [Thermoprotei archaeon ex4572_64]